MSKIKDLKAKLSEVLVKSDPYIDGASLIPKPDYDAIEKQIDPKTKGKERGLQNNPPLGTTEPDEVELLIISTFQEMLDKAGEDVRNTIATYNNRLLGFDLKGVLEDIRDICRSSVSDFGAEIVKAKEEITNAKELVKDKERDLELFKKENKLIRSASYPSEDKKYLKYGILALLFLVETIGNAVFLSKGNEFGIVGSYTEAIYISFLNLMAGILIGNYVSRNLFSINKFLKYSSAILILIVLIFAGGWNLLIAHYREVSGIGLLGDAGVMAIQSMKDDPLALQSLQSWVLFFVGWLFWLIALIDTHTLDDNYPKYGVVSRALNDAREDFAFSKSMIIEHLGALKEHSEQVIKDLRTELGEIQSRVSYLSSQKALTIEDYEVFSQKAENQFQRLINIYRDANKSERTRSPSSFRKKLKLNIPKINDVAVIDSPEKLNRNIEEGRKELDSSIDIFYSKFDDAVNELDSLKDLKIQGLEALSKGKEGKE